MLTKYYAYYKGGVLDVEKIVLLIGTFFLGFTMLGCSESSIESEDNMTMEETKMTKNDWKVSPLFKVGGLKLIGEEGRLGFVYDDSEFIRFYPKNVQKYMWHFWGTNQELEGRLKVLATHENEQSSIVLTEGDLSGENNGADRHFPSNMSLPKSGIWKLDAYIGDDVFGSVFVQVHEGD